LFRRSRYITPPGDPEDVGVPPVIVLPVVPTVNAAAVPDVSDTVIEPMVFAETVWTAKPKLDPSALVTVTVEPLTAAENPVSAAPLIASFTFVAIVAVVGVTPVNPTEIDVPPTLTLKVLADVSVKPVDPKVMAAVPGVAVATGAA
jgi:hypothetical protein